MKAVLSVQNATSAYGTANSATATVTATTGTTTGSVQFSVDGAASGAPVQLSSGTATYSLPVLITGTHTVTAAYSGDNTFASATLTGIPLVVAKAGTTTALALSSTSINPGQSETFTATVTSATTDIPTGTVAFLDGTTVLATPTISNGVATTPLPMSETTICTPRTWQRKQFSLTNDELSVTKRGGLGSEKIPASDLALKGNHHLSPFAPEKRKEPDSAGIWALL